MITFHYKLTWTCFSDKNIQLKLIKKNNYIMTTQSNNSHILTYQQTPHLNNRPFYIGYYTDVTVSKT